MKKWVGSAVAVMIYAAVAATAAQAATQTATRGHGDIAAAARYPSRPLRMVIPLAPGGGSDIVGRILALALADYWRQPVVVDNRPGAGSTVGTAIVAKAPADGYTVLVSSSSVAISPALYRNLDFDVRRDLAGVSLLASQPSLLAVHSSVPVSSFRELLSYAKERPGKLMFGSAGVGSATHLGGELLKVAANINLLHVPYKSAGLATTALLAGEVQVLVTNMASVLPHTQSGRMKVLAITSRERSPAATAIPTMAEAGLAGFEYATWYGLFVPARSAKAAIDVLHVATAAVLRQPTVRERLTAQGLDVHATTPASFNGYFAGEITRWDGVIRSAGLGGK